MISISLNTSKIDRSKLYESPKTGTKYLNLILLNQEDNFGNRIVIQPVSKEAYQAGERGEQVGTWREFGSKSARKPEPRRDGLVNSPEAAAGKGTPLHGENELGF